MSIISKILTYKRCYFPSHSNLGSAGANSNIGIPTYVTSPEALHVEENCVIRWGAHILNNKNEHVYIKKYTVISTHCTIVTNNHHSTVGIPQVLLGASHINDTSTDLHIDEDVYVGTNVTILEGAHLGRGCIVGACSTVTKPVPPYALVVGSPAKIVGVKFSIDQILEHEEALYPKKERFSRAYLEELFANYYEGKKVFGVKTELTKKDLEALEQAKAKRGFIEPEL